MNKYVPDQPDHVDVLDIDNTAVREAQIKRLNAVREGRDEAACRAALEA